MPTYTVQNDSANPRMIYHGGSGTHVPASSAVNVDMTEAEAKNAEADGVLVSPAKEGRPAKGQAAAAKQGKGKRGGKRGARKAKEPVQQPEVMRDVTVQD